MKMVAPSTESYSVPMPPITTISRMSIMMAKLSVVSGDRKSVVQGKSVSVRVDLGGRRIIKKKKKKKIKQCEPTTETHKPITSIKTQKRTATNEVYATG